YFLSQAGVKLTDLKGESGFSGSHDKTIKLVEAGSFDAGVLNEQVWKSRLKKGEVDTSKVAVLFSTPAYFDYHWVLGPKVSKKRGAEFVARLKAAFVKLDPANAEDKEILSLFGAKKFIPTANENYSQIEAIGREIGKIK
ncbi:MAG: PhnD/SsuA/transferrin family substrate-binding protein, partial [Spirochaetia bacterium]|nr:PhnD/SsuA/transferrin family substrate-binding protein [Spirochaetia bacterium]